MAGRPRLVHEGSPIIDDRKNSGFSSVWSDGDRAPAGDAHHANNFAGIASAADNASIASKPYKLQTRLVVGEGSNEEEDLDMMMVEDGHDQYNHYQHGRNCGGYGGHGHEDRGHYGQQQQYNVGNSMFPTVHYEHRTQATNVFYNDGHRFAPTDQIDHAPSSNQPRPIAAQSTLVESPLVVIDAANIAYNYARSLNPCQGSQRQQPDPRGIRLAIDYLKKNNCRVQTVLHKFWYQLKPRPADHYHLKNRSRGDSDAKMITDEVEELRSLRQQGFLVECPPGDDDDAYALALARKEDDRVIQCQGMHQDESMDMEDDVSRHLPKAVLGGYILSNDFFQDAKRRDEKNHQHHPLNMRPLSLNSWLKKHRISYSFADVGGTGIGGERRLEFLPNPRNDLIEAMDACNRLNFSMP